MYTYYMYLFRIKPQFTNHYRDFDSDGNETLAESKPMHVQRALQEALHFATPRTAQRCLGREFTAAVITSCTRRWEIALQAAAGFSRNLGKSKLLEGEKLILIHLLQTCMIFWNLYIYI